MHFDYAQCKQKGLAGVYILVGILVVLTIAGGAYFLGKSNKSEPAKVVSQPAQQIVKASPTPESTSSQNNTQTFSAIDSWTMSSTSNIDFLVTSPTGQQEGVLPTTKTSVNTLPNASYGVQIGIKDPTGKTPPLPDMLYFNLDSPANGTYTLQVIPVKPGNYHIDVAFSAGIGATFKSKEVSIDGSLKTNQNDKYAVTLPSGTIQKNY